LIDANSLIHRAFHALPPFSAPDGRPTGAIYGVSRILLKLFREEKPEFAAALFDRPEPTFREKAYKEYKAHRPETPEALSFQLAESQNLFRKFGIKPLEASGYEADDLIATLAQKFKNEKDLRIVILTGDLDTLQLVCGDKVVVRTFKKGISDTFTYNEEAVKERYGIPPSELADYKALVGDPSDNIPGIPGVGPKTAAALLRKYSSVENIARHLDDEPRLREKTPDFKRQAVFSKKLVTLKRDVPLRISRLSELKVAENPADLLEFFRSLGFETLLKQLSPDKHEAVPSISSKAGGGSFFTQAKDNNLLLIPEEVGLLKIRHSKRDWNSSKLKVGFHLKERLKEAWNEGKQLRPPYFDLGIAFWLLDPDLKNYEPEAVFKRFLKKQWTADILSLEEAFVFARQKLAEYELTKIFEEIEMPVLTVLAEMEYHGVAVNIEKLKALEKKIDARLSQLTAEIYRLTGEEFNINSPQQLARVLFEKLGIKGKSMRKTAGGKPSTDASALIGLKNVHPVIPLLLEYREDFKINSTYVKALQGLVGKDGRVHTEFVQTGTATGRVSSQNPNLQNIPKESIYSDELRSAFEAPPSHHIIAFDYSQIDLRLLAELSQDEKMLEAFRNNLDIHQMTAAKIFRVPYDDVRPEMRRVAKTLNFGLVYGMGVSAFASASGLSRTSASEFIQTYFSEFPGIREWQERVKQEAKSRGYVQTPLGRRRYLPYIASGSGRIVSQAERIAINLPVQGFTADITKLAMIKAKESLEKEKLWGNTAKLVLHIHDELLFEVADDSIDRVVSLVRPIMENVYRLSVPLSVSVSSGKNWGEMQKIL